MAKATLIKKVRQMFGNHPKSKQDVVQILHYAASQSILDPHILSMMEHVLEVEETKVKDVMVPRSKMICLEYNWSFSQVTQAVTESGHSRLPTIGANKEEVLGILLAKDLLSYTINHDPSQFNLYDLLRPVAVIPETKHLHVLLQDFRRNRNHLAIVVDEYGRVVGLITIEDVLEEIVGEIEDEHDTDDTPLIRQEADGSYLVKAGTTIEEFNKFFNSDLDADGVETIGGLIMRTMGRLPKRGEHVTVDGLAITVLKADNRRIYSLGVSNLNVIS